MSFDKTSLVRQLIPKSYHFDGYNEINCQNSRDKPFFSENTIPMGNYFLAIRLVNSDTISIEFESVCVKGKIIFHPYILSLEEFVSKLQKSIQNGSDFIAFEIQPRYDNFCLCNKCTHKTEDCSVIRRIQPSKFFAAVSFYSSDVKEALASYFEISNKQSSKGGKLTMKKRNNIFGMNFELGLSKDPNIAATLMGVAVRNPSTGNWYTFDVTKNTRKNLASLKMGNFPIFLLPTKDFVVGDLTKIDGKYYYVKSINSNNTITLIGAADGIIREMLAEESIIPGMTIHTKVVAFDTKSLIDTSSKENMGSNVLAAMCMMQWANGSQDEFSLDNITDDSFNGLGSCLPMVMAMGGDFGNMFTGSDGKINLPMLMMIGSTSGDSDSNGMMQMLVLSQLLGGSNASSLSEVLPTPAGSAKEEEKKVKCESCGQTYSADTVFCPKCGTKTAPITTVCRKCGTALRENATFCHNCGQRVAPEVCPYCGRQIEGDEFFCPGCGVELNSKSTTATPKAKSSTKTKSNSKSASSRAKKKVTNATAEISEKK